MPLNSFTALAILRREVRRNRRDADDRPARRICIHAIPVMSLPWNALVLQERKQRQKSKGLDLETVGGLIYFHLLCDSTIRHILTDTGLYHRSIVRHSSSERRDSNPEATKMAVQRLEEDRPGNQGSMSRTSDVPSFATKISPSVLSLASSTSTLVTPSRRPFVQETGFTALFDHWMPFAGVLITKYAAQTLSISLHPA